MSNQLQVQFAYIPKLQFLHDERWLYRYYVFYGGRICSKSKSTAQKMVALALGNHTKNMIKDNGLIFDPLKDKDEFLILCVREVQEKLAESVKSNIEKVMENLGLLGKHKNGAFFESTENEIRGVNGSRFIFSGLSNQTAEQIKSLENADVCWVEEADSISERSWTLLTPTIRKERRYINPLTYKFDPVLTKTSCIYITFNPSTDQTATYKRFVANPPERSKVVFLTYRDLMNLKNPVTGEDLEWLSSAAREEIKNAKINDPLFYNTYDGIPLKEGKYSLWNNELLSSCKIKPEKTSQEYLTEMRSRGARFYLSIDPAVTVNKNSDFSGIIYGFIYNNQVYIVKDFTKPITSLTDNIQEVYMEIRRNRYPLDEVIWETNQGGTELMKLANIFGVWITPIYQVVKKKDRLITMFEDYKNNRVFHLSFLDDPVENNLKEYELDLLKYTLDEKSRSLYNLKLDRIDAAASLVTELLFNRRDGNRMSRPAESMSNKKQIDNCYLTATEKDDNQIQFDFDINSYANSYIDE